MVDITKNMPDWYKVEIDKKKREDKGIDWSLVIFLLILLIWVIIYFLTTMDSESSTIKLMVGKSW